MSRTVMVLGGYGTTGSRIAELLLRETKARVVVAGRRLVEAKRLSGRLARVSVGDRVSPVLADTGNRTLLVQALREVDLVVVASSTAADVRTVAEAAIEAGTDYLDIQGSAAKVRFLESVADVVERNGRCFITDGGLHPGLPGVLVRFAAGFMDRVQRANVASMIQLDWRNLELSTATTTEFATELLECQPKWYKQGRWVRSWRESRKFAFGAPFGTRKVRPMYLQELARLPDDYPSLTETGYFLSGFNWFVDWLALPFGSVALRLGGSRVAGPVGRLLWWGLRRFSRPPFGAVFLVDANGWKRGRIVSVRGNVTHDDPYTLTAIPVVACVMQYLDGSVRKPGLWYQALAVEPRRFLTDMERLGAKVEYDLDVET